MGFTLHGLRSDEGFVFMSNLSMLLPKAGGQGNIATDHRA